MGTGQTHKRLGGAVHYPIARAQKIALDECLTTNGSRKYDRLHLRQYVARLAEVKTDYVDLDEDDTAFVILRRNKKGEWKPVIPR